MCYNIITVKETTPKNRKECDCMFTVVYSEFSGCSLKREFASLELAEAYALGLMDITESSFEILILEGVEIIESYLYE